MSNQSIPGLLEVAAQNLVLTEHVKALLQIVPTNQQSMQLIHQAVRAANEAAKATDNARFIEAVAAANKSLTVPPRPLG